MTSKSFEAGRVNAPHGDYERTGSKGPQGSASESPALSEEELDCRKRLSDTYEGQYRNGVFTNCGYHGTASGYIVRDGTYWIATFRSRPEADDYVSLRNAERTSG
jgi:hypothetical protein